MKGIPDSSRAVRSSPFHSSAFLSSPYSAFRQASDSTLILRARQELEPQRSQALWKAVGHGAGAGVLLILKARRTRSARRTLNGGALQRPPRAPRPPRASRKARSLTRRS